MSDPLHQLESDQPAERWRAAEALLDRANDVQALTALRQALADEHPFVRWHAAQALSTSARGRQHLLEALRQADLSPLARGAAADAVASAGLDPREAAPLLLAALDSGDPLLRQSAVEALARRVDHQALPRLTALLEDENVWVRRAAAKALGHSGDPNVAGALVQRLSDESAIVRRSAAYALGALKAAAAIGPLIDALADADAMVRLNSAWALGRIGRAAAAALPALRNLQTETALAGILAKTARRSERAILRPAWLTALAEIGGSGISGTGGRGPMGAVRPLLERFLPGRRR